VRQWRIIPLPFLRQWRRSTGVRIIRTNRYRKDLRRLKVTAAEAAAIEAEIASEPEAGDVIQGLSGLRKLRFGFGGRSKRGGGRAVYFLMVADDTAALIFAYAKNEQTDLTEAQKKAAMQIMKELKDG
jgi:hypothetical protein